MRNFLADCTRVLNLIKKKFRMYGRDYSIPQLRAIFEGKAVLTPPWW
jgi:hypothetical protein